MTRPFTGRHLACIVVAFFAVVIAVNMLMATLAGRSFGGLVVANSYVASQRFNGWLDEADAQRRMGWRAEAARGACGELRNGEGCVTVTLHDGSSVLDAGSVTAVAIHPLGRLPETTLTFRPLGSGRYGAIEDLPAGRWKLHLRVEAGGRTARFIEDLPA